MPSNVLVTGGAGCIGTRLAARLRIIGSEFVELVPRVLQLFADVAGRR